MSTLTHKLTHNSNRRGFTLVELLVVIAIIATLIGLLLPAVQSAREAARRTGCSFNIRGLSQAIQVYESTRRRLPAATDRNEGQSRPGSAAAGAQLAGYSWIFHILPYMEEGAIYNNISGNTAKFQNGPFSAGFNGQASPPAGGAWTAQNATAANRGTHASAVVISQLLCPSSGGGSTVETDANGPSSGLSFAQEYVATQTAVGGQVAVTNYKAMAGTHMINQPTLPSGTALMPAPNGAIQFIPDTPIPAALMANAQTQSQASRQGIQAGAISDGMSKTVMIAETKERGYSSWIDGTTCWVVAYDPNAGIPFNVNGTWSTVQNAITPITRCALSVQPSLTPLVRFLPAAQFNTRLQSGGMAFGPSSDHQGGIVMHAFGDTHVSQVTADVDPNVYMAICSRNGSEPTALQE
jgi:prepilin-type N-terminal cleavage/methylation domain-containing protein